MNTTIKQVSTPGYNYMFNKENGAFARWGKTYDDDPSWSPLGPELLDIEISTKCNRACRFCYKSNTKDGQHMSLSTFEQILKNVPSNINQIAFGVGDTNGNPDMWKIFEHCRVNDVVPNVTINGNGLSNSLAKRFASICGAVAVSHYNSNVCYNAVSKLSNAGLFQVNIHQLVALETYDKCIKLLNDIETDPRLSGLNAVVFLSLKRTGRGTSMTQLPFDKFSSMVNDALDRGLSIGFDSCTANKFLLAIKDRPEYPYLQSLSEPCESGLFSAYINVEGKFFPCSFTELGEGIDTTNQDFMKVWLSPSLEEWRNRLLDCGRSCPVYEV